MDEHILRNEGGESAAEPTDAPRWPLVAVAPRKTLRGVEIVADHWTKSNREGVVEAGFRVVDVHTALHRTYTTDAHLATYVVRGRDGLPLGSQPRINKEGLGHMGHYGWTVDIQVLFCDIDNPSHARWKDDDLQAAIDAYETTWGQVEELASLGIYFTRGGYRVLHLLDRPVSPEEAESLLGVLHDRLERHGLAVDRKCKDWTRLFRLPNVKRDGRRERSRFLDLSRLRPVRLEAPRGVRMPAPAARAARAPRPPRERAPAPAPLGPLGDRWLPFVERVARAVRAEPDDWHALFLALAGALVERDLEPSEVPALCVAVALATGADSKVDDRRKAAASTVARARAGRPVAGFRALVERWPSVAFALDRALEAAREAPAAPPPAPAAGPSEPELAARLAEAIRDAPEGLTVLQVACGTGKTRAAEAVALERSKKPHAAPHAEGGHAPLDSKTSLSFDKNALSLESYERLRAHRAPVERRFGALAREKDGEPVCAYFAVAEPLVAGGQSLAGLFCDHYLFGRCPRYDGCEARERREGTPRARIVLGTHALLRELDAVAGKTGLLILDEPPALLETKAFDAKALRAARSMLPDFDPVFAAALLPLVLALAEYVDDAPEGDGPALGPAEALAELAPLVIAKHLAGACNAADVTRTDDVASDLGRAVAAAIAPERRSRAAPLGPRVAFRLRQNDETYAKRLGAASAVLGTLYRLFGGPDRGVLRVRRRDGRAQALVTLPNRALATALRRCDRVVVLDANADLHLPIYERLVDAPPRYVRLPTPPDGAPVERRVVAAFATRTRWKKQGQFRPSPELTGAVRALVDWALDGPSRGALAVITYRALRLVFEAAWRPDDPAPAEAWAKEGWARGDLDALAASLAPELARWPGELLFGHYGGVRGLDAMKHADALATLGDPWPNLDDVRTEVAFLGLEQTWEARAEAMCRAELEQAHGRLRTIHRTRPARAAHVGMVRPGGEAWEAVAAPLRPQGRPKTKAALSTLAFTHVIEALGGVRATARLLGCSRGTLQGYFSGAYAVPAEVAERCERALAAKAGRPGPPADADAGASEAAAVGAAGAVDEASGAGNESAVSEAGETDNEGEEDDAGDAGHGSRGAPGEAP